jgi:hypothetical protein
VSEVDAGSVVSVAAAGATPACVGAVAGVWSTTTAAKPPAASARTPATDSAAGFWGGMSLLSEGGGATGV